MGIDKNQLRGLITGVLQATNLYSPAAVELLMLTAAVETNLGTYIKQISGPALGIFQVEPRTHDDMWNRFIKKDIVLYQNIKRFIIPGVALRDNMMLNLAYQIIMSRIYYLMVPEPLPASNDVEGLARYWKKHYNTYAGKGTVEQAVEKYKEYCL